MMDRTADACCDVEEPESSCWICFEGAEAGELRRVCSCPRKVHQPCLARWQLHQAGKSEERQCRFCKTTLQDWKPLMSTGCRVAAPVMRVSFAGKTFKLKVSPGEDGVREFEAQIRRLLQLPEDQEFDVVFFCRAPNTGDKLQLQGLCAFDAAVHCASMTSLPQPAAQHDCAARRGGGGGGKRQHQWLRQLLQRICQRLDLGGSSMQTA